MLNCPLCHGRRIHRSKRKGIFERKVLAMISVRPYRCDQCDHRFFHRSVAHCGGLRKAQTHIQTVSLLKSLSTSRSSASTTSNETTTL
jgi:hypothetical protein